MSSAVNHRKRSHRSEQYKSAVFKAQNNKALYDSAQKQHNQNVLGRIASIFHRRSQRPTSVKREVTGE